MRHNKYTNNIIVLVSATDLKDTDLYFEIRGVRAQVKMIGNVCLFYYEYKYDFGIDNTSININRSYISDLF